MSKAYNSIRFDLTECSEKGEVVKLADYIDSYGQEAVIDAIRQLRAEDIVRFEVIGNVAMWLEQNPLCDDSHVIRYFHCGPVAAVEVL